MRQLALLLVLSLSTTAFAQSAADERRRTFGAVNAPAQLPDGGMAAYGYVGVPELAAGYRQGAGGVEWEARARFDFLRVQLGVEGLIRKELWTLGPVSIAPSVGLGIIGGTGATYFYERNYAHVSGRFIPGATVVVPLSETIRAVGLVELPLDIGWARVGDNPVRFQALGGAGLEVYVGEDMVLNVAGLVGLDTERRPLGENDTKLGWGVRVGLGQRFF